MCFTRTSVTGEGKVVLGSAKGVKDGVNRDCREVVSAGELAVAVTEDVALGPGEGVVDGENMDCEETTPAGGENMDCSEVMAGAE